MSSPFSVKITTVKEKCADIPDFSGYATKWPQDRPMHGGGVAWLGRSTNPRSTLACACIGRRRHSRTSHQGWATAWVALSRAPHGANPREGGMPCPVVKIFGKRIILLNGYRDRLPTVRKNAGKSPKVDSIRQLRQCSKQYPDAIAFGYVAGRWMPAA